MARIRSRPRSFPVVDRDVRKALLRRFPYAVIFELGKRRVTVLAVCHGRRKPRGWSDRISEPPASTYGQAHDRSTQPTGPGGGRSVPRGPGVDRGVCRDPGRPPGPAGRTGGRTAGGRRQGAPPVAGLGPSEGARRPPPPRPALLHPIASRRDHAPHRSPSRPAAGGPVRGGAPASGVPLATEGPGPTG